MINNAKNFINGDSEKYIRINRTMSERGLFSYLYTMIIAAYYSDKKGIKLYVDWSDADNYLDKKMNLFDYFFEQPFKVKSVKGYKIVMDDCNIDRFIKNSWNQFHKSVISHPYNYVNNFNDRERFAKLVKKYVKIKPHIILKTDNFYNKFLSEKTLAVHIRGLHMRRIFDPYLKTHKPTPPLEMFYKFIDNELRMGDYDTLFICSDDLELIRKCSRRYLRKNLLGFKKKINVIIDPFFKSNCSEGLEHIEKYDGSKLQLAEESLILSLILSKCKCLINQWSNVSNFSAVFNPKIKLLNITNSKEYNSWYYFYFYPLHVPIWIKDELLKKLYRFSKKFRSKSKIYEKFINSIRKLISERKKNIRGN